MKFAAGGFVIDKKYTGELDIKVIIFLEQTKTRKTIFPAMVTTIGTKKNDYYTGKIQAELMMENLF